MVREVEGGGRGLVGNGVAVCGHVCVGACEFVCVVSVFPCVLACVCMHYIYMYLILYMCACGIDICILICVCILYIIYTYIYIYIKIKVATIYPTYKRFRPRNQSWLVPEQCWVLCLYIGLQFP